MSTPIFPHCFIVTGHFVVVNEEHWHGLVWDSPGKTTVSQISVFMKQNMIPFLQICFFL